MHSLWMKVAPGIRDTAVAADAAPTHIADVEQQAMQRVSSQLSHPTNQRIVRECRCLE
jgi:hypothetical protein